MNPREIMGRSWWNRERKKAFGRQQFRCLACGVHKDSAKYHQWLEGHEYYDIDYDKGVVKFDIIIGLCHSCHNYIHSGRLQVFLIDGKVSFKKFNDILEHGFAILKKAGLRPNSVTYYIWLMSVKHYSQHQAVSYLRENGFDIDTYLAENDKIPWGEWYLDFYGKKFYSKFASYRRWREHYNQ